MKLTRSTFFLGCLVGGFGAGALPLLIQLSSQPAHADTKLLPFQGRLTNADGTPITPDQAKVVEFKMYDAPTGGTVKWAGEVHKLSVNGGLVNTMLGTKAPLGGVDFSTTPTYLQITVDANNDGQITPADPPLLPRQSVVGAVYASVAGEIQYNTSGALASVKGSDLFDPAGKIKALAIEANNAITAAQLADDSVAAGELASNAVGTPELQDNAVSVAKMQDDSVGTAELIGNDTVPAVTGAVTSEKIADGTIQSRDLSVGLQNAVTPPGTVVAYAGITVPTGWELCDGREVGRTDPKYAALWTAIGTIHGVGNGTTTFNLPDYRGRFLRGMDDPDGNGPIQAAGRDPDVAGRKDRVGLAVGGVMGSVQEDAFQGHYHELVLGSNTGGTRWGFSGSSTDNRNMTDTGGTKFDNIGYGYTAATITTDYSHGPPRVSSETRPKNAYVNYLIKY